MGPIVEGRTRFIVFHFKPRELKPGTLVSLSGGRTLYMDSDTARILNSKPNEVGKVLKPGESVKGPWTLFPLIRTIYTHKQR